MTFPYHAEIFVNDTWTDITTRVLGHERGFIEITQGRTNESSTHEPCKCRLTLNNRGGEFSPLNSLGTYYGSLDLNTPFRVFKTLDTAGFAATVSSAWPNTDGGAAWTTFGAGGALNASDYSSSSGKGNHSVPAANAYRSTYLAATTYRRVDFQVTCSMDTTNITGAQVSWNILIAGESTSVYRRIAIEVQTDETIKLSLYTSTGTQWTTTTLLETHSSSQALTIRVQAEGTTVRAKVWISTVPEPYDWSLIGYYFTPIDTLGWVGVQSRRDTGNTNGTIVFSYDNVEIRNDRFFGEIPGWPVEFDTTGRDIWVTIEAASVMRRIGITDAPAASIMRTLIPTIGTSVADLIAYWPLEERPSAVAGAALVQKNPNTTTVTLQGNTKALSQHFGRGDLNAWLYPVMALYGDGRLEAGDIGFTSADFTGTEGWRFAVVLKSTGDQQWSWTIVTETSPSLVHSWVLTFKPATTAIDVTLPTGAVQTLLAETSAVFFDNDAHAVVFGAHQTGADITWGITIDTPLEGGASEAFTLAATTLERPTWWYIQSVAPHTGALSVGHMAVWNADFGSSIDVDDGITGMRGELTGYRMGRVPFYEGVQLYVEGDPQESLALGPQPISSLSSQLDEYEAADGGLLGDAFGTLGLTYRMLSSMCNQTARVSLDYTGAELVLGLLPTYDDQLVANKVTATSSGGGEATFEVTTGPMSTAAPKDGGIGTYQKKVPYNVAADTQLLDQAGWRANLGTVHENRLASVKVHLNRTAVADKVHQLSQVGLGDRIDITNLPVYLNSETRQLTHGWVETINRFEQTLQFFTRPESPYEVGVADDSTYGRAAAGASYLAENIGTGTTSFLVKSLDGTRWTTSPSSCPVILGGERMTLTAVANTVPSFVAAGTAAHGDNASVVPGLPGGATTTGDLLLILAAIRNTAASITTPTGYTRLITVGSNVVLFGKIHSGSESAPTVAFTGGSAGDTTSAHMCALHNAPIALFTATNVTSVNGSAQDITLPATDLVGVDSIVVAFGWKQDDWTSSAPPGLWTEIGEPSSTTGNDQGITWAYRIYDGNARLAPGPFVITGGAAAVSRSGLAAFGNWQIVTVTRSVNGVVKAHTAAVTEPARFNLAYPVKVAKT